MNRPWVLVLMMLLLVGLGVSLFFMLFEKREDVVNIGPQGEARANPYLAAERFLAAMGHETESYSRFTTDMGLPPEDGTLLLLTGRLTLTSKRQEQILEWVNRGGALVTVVQQPRSLEAVEDVLPDDPLLDFFGLELNTTGEQDTVAFDMLDGNELDVALESELRFEDPENRAFESFEDQYGLVAMLLHHGEGRVVLLNEAAFFTNKNIGDLQHAAFFYQLALLGNERPSLIWLVFREAYPPLSELLARHAWMALVSLVLLIVIGIWAFAPRLGPVRPDPPPIRRRLMEHIEAGGQFLWRHQGAQNLVRSAREAMVARIRQRHPGWLNLTEKEQRHHLREITGLPAHAVALALDSGELLDEERFVTIIGNIEKIRRAL